MSYVATNYSRALFPCISIAIWLNLAFEFALVSSLRLFIPSIRLCLLYCTISKDSRGLYSGTRNNLNSSRVVGLLKLNSLNGVQCIFIWLFNFSVSFTGFFLIRLRATFVLVRFVYCICLLKYKPMFFK